MSKPTSLAKIPLPKYATAVNGFTARVESGAFGERGTGFMDGSLYNTFLAGRWVYYLWPGAAQLWLGGRWEGLAAAVVSAWTLNAALATTFLWTEIAASGTILALWGAVIAQWGGGAAWTRAWLRRRDANENDGSRPDLFPAALSEYLKGNWYAVEGICKRLIAVDEHDVDAQLLLAGVCRRTNRLEEAESRLGHLERVTGADKWTFEIAVEREQLATLREIRRKEENEPAVPVRRAA